MMKTLLFLGLLFFVLSPGVLLTLPRGGSKMVVAATHAVVFVAIWYFTRRYVVENVQDDDEAEYEAGFQSRDTAKASLGGGGCFPASSTVTVDDGSDSGKKTQMSDLKIGDKVLVVDASTGATSFSDVYFFGHRDSESVSNFYTVTTASGSSLQLTPDHYMYVAETGCNESITAATTLSPNLVKVGMGAWVHTPEGMKCSAIVDIRQSEEKGLYNPQTLTGSILVNEMHASSYSAYSDIPVEKFLSSFMTAENVARNAPTAWHTLFAPVRTLYLNNGPEWATRVTRPYDADGWKNLSMAAVTSTMIKESLLTA
jgi:hypothetical protein